MGAWRDRGKAGPLVGLTRPISPTVEAAEIRVEIERKLRAFVRDCMF